MNTKIIIIIIIIIIVVVVVVYVRMPNGPCIVTTFPR